MRCPFCSNQDSQVKDSRPTEDNTAIRRRRICDQCGSRFTTFERIQLRDLVAVKTNGQKEVFDRDKMFRSLSLALRKRNIEQDKIEKIINIEDTEESDIANSIPASPVVITPDLTVGIPWRGALVYSGDLEGKITKINLTNMMDDGQKPVATPVFLYDHTTIFNLGL